MPLEDRTLTEDFPEVYRVGDRGREWELFWSLTSVGFDARGRLHIADLVGDELRVVEHVAARARAKVERGGAAAEMAGLMGGGGRFESWLDEAELSGAIEVVEALETSWEGKIWVLRTPVDGFPDYDLLAEAMSALTGSPPGVQPRRPGQIDILTAEGGYVGTLPEAGMPAAFGPNGLVAYVHLDAFDVPTVVVRRVPEAMRE